MSGLEFASATIGQLVWPILIFIALMVLKEPLKKLASSAELRRAKVGPSGVEVEFERQLDEAKRELAQAELESPKPSPSPEQEQRARDFVADMRDLARVKPSAAVVESSKVLEQLLRDSVDVPPKKRDRFLGLRTLARLAADQGVLSKNEAGVLDEMIYLRNLAAHSADAEISYAQATEYAELVRDLAISLRFSPRQTNDGDDPL